MENNELELLDSKIVETFNQYFATWGIRLLEDASKTEHGYIISKKGWTINMVIDSTSKEIELYCTHRMTNDIHFCIRKDGSIKNLEALDEAYTYSPEIPGDKEKQEQNHIEKINRIYEELKSKGIL